MEQNTIMKFLEFQKEFKELLLKHNVEISGNCRDDGGMVMDLYDKDLDWHFQSNIIDMNTFMISDEIEGHEYYINIMDKYIINMFPKENRTDYCKNTDTLIFTQNRDKVIQYMDRFDNVVNKRISKDNIDFELSNGREFRWVNPTQNSRGNRCRYAVIDRDLNLFENNERLWIILPICIHATQDTVEII